VRRRVRICSAARSNLKTAAAGRVDIHAQRCVNRDTGSAGSPANGRFRLSMTLAMLYTRGRKRSIAKLSDAAQGEIMKSLVRSMGLAGGILVLAGVQNASAQVTDPVEFTTSFPFTVGYGTMPAGSYTIRPDDDNQEIFELTGAQGSVLFQAMNTEAGQTPSKTEVVFKRYGDGYVLKDVWLEGSDIGLEAVAVEGEKHLAKRQSSPTEEHVAARKNAKSSTEAR
jgi:hypothetical protein